MPKCAECGKNVFKNDPNITLNKVWHKSCFRCSKCYCELNPEFAKVHKGNVYCNTCLKILKKCCSNVSEDDAATLYENNIQNYNSCSSHNCIKLLPVCSNDSFPKFERCGPKNTRFVLPRELANYCNRNQIGDRCTNSPICYKNRVRPCSICVACSRKKYPKQCISRSSSCLERAVKSLKKRGIDNSYESIGKCGGTCNEPKYGFAKKFFPKINKGPRYIGYALCKRCGEKAYAAELVLTSYGAYHKSCFSCYSCLKPLDTSNFEEQSGEIFCRRCYKKYFGHNHYGFRNRIL